MGKVNKSRMFLYTKYELQKIQLDRLLDLIDYTGSISHLATMLNKPTSTVERWMYSGKISKAGAIAVESNQSLGNMFKAYYLRPDLYAEKRSVIVKDYIKAQGGLCLYSQEDIDFWGKRELDIKETKEQILKQYKVNYAARKLKQK